MHTPFIAQEEASEIADALRIQLDAGLDSLPAHGEVYHVPYVENPAPVNFMADGVF